MRVAIAAWAVAVLLHAVVPRDPPSPTPISAPVLVLLSGGQPHAAATAAWSTTVVHQASGEPDGHALHQGIAMARRFDPALQAPAVYGPILLRRAGEPEAAAEILTEAREQWPEEPYFPWALGMNAWLEGDLETAADWLDRAEELEPSGIHGEAAEALRAR